MPDQAVDYALWWTPLQIRRYHECDMQMPWRMNHSAASYSYRLWRCEASSSCGQDPYSWLSSQNDDWWTHTFTSWQSILPVHTHHCCVCCGCTELLSSSFQTLWNDTFKWRSGSQIWVFWVQMQLLSANMPWRYCKLTLVSYCQLLMFNNN
jgi:hypothetical protein